MRIEKISRKYKQLMQKGKVDGTWRLHIDKEINLNLKATMKTKGGCGPSGLDADNWHRILKSQSFDSSPVDLWKSFGIFGESIYIKDIHISEIELEK